MSSSKKLPEVFHGVSAEQAKDAVTTLIKYIGEDPKRDGLLRTPERVCRALLEMTDGYHADIGSVLATTFEANADEMVLLKDIEFTSLCEHHMLSFTGKAHVAYLPSQGRIAGLSKLARIVDIFAARLQVQERMTEQIALAIQEHLQPIGVGVVVQGQHSCMCARGVKKQGATMITSCMLGQFRESPATRHEFMGLIRA
jgi:GTP cyclohydrolase I